MGKLEDKQCDSVVFDKELAIRLRPSKSNKLDIIVVVATLHKKESTL